MKEAVVLCPYCQSDYVFSRKPGEYLCGACNRPFFAAAQEAEQTDEELLSTKTTTPTYMFISYAHVQGEIVELIAKGLEERGHRFWFDQQDIDHDDDWREAITEGIRTSNGVISFLSSEAVGGSGVCMDELSIAVGCKYGNIHTVLLQKEVEVRPPAQLTHRQWLDMSDWKRMKAQGEAVFQPWFREKLAKLIRVIERPESRMFVGQISTIREKLGIMDTAVSRQNWYLTQRFVGRKWLVKRIEDWLKDPQGGRLCVLYGGPGAGKSAFAAQYAYHSSSVAASIFFEHGNEHFNTASSLIRSLVFQLACRLPAYRSLVYGIVTTDNTLSAMNEQELFNRLLTIPLGQQTIDGGHETLCIVLDGLDECTSREKNSVAQLLGRYAQHFPSWLRLLVLSRDESSVSGQLEPDATLDMADSREESLLDVRRYYEERLQKLLSEREDAQQLLDELTARTQDVFLYAYVVSKMILDGKLELGRPDVYPKGLNSAFRLWFERYYPDLGEYRRLHRIMLGVIAGSGTPVPVEELDRLSIAYDEATDSYRMNPPGQEGQFSAASRLERIAPMLRYDQDAYGKQTVAFTHKYIAEWLTLRDGQRNRSEAGPYFCDVRASMRILAICWRGRMEAGLELTQFEALNLSDYAQQTEEPQTEEPQTAAKVAGDERLELALKRYREAYRKEFRYGLALEFAMADVRRCEFLAELEGTIRAKRKYGSAMYEAMVVSKEDEKYEMTVVLAERVLGMLETIYGKTKMIRWKQIFGREYAEVYRKLGRYQDAMELSKEWMECCRQTLGETNPTTLKAKESLASDYCRLYQYQEARTLEEQVLEVRKQILGEKHPDTQSAMKDLARVYYHLMYYRDSLEKREQVLEASRRNLGENHPKTLEIMEILADGYGYRRRYKEQHEMYEKLLKARMRSLGANHPDTQRTMESLAFVCDRQGNIQRTRELREQMLEARIQSLGANHPDTLRAMEGLAHVYKRIINEGSPETMEQVFEASRRLFEKNYPDMFNEVKEEYEEEMRLRNRKKDLILKKQIKADRDACLLKVNRQSFGDMNSVTLKAMEDLAEGYRQLSRNQEARKLDEHVLKIRKQTLGENHPAMLKAIENLAKDYRRLIRVEKPLELSKQILKSSKQFFGDNHPETLEIMEALAGQYEDFARYQEARELHEQVLESRIQLQGANHHDTLRTMENLIYDYRCIVESQDSQEMWKQVLEASKRILGEDHPATLNIMMLIADKYYNCGNYQKARELHEQVLVAKKQVLGAEHRDTLNAMRELAYDYKKLIRTQDSQEIREQVMEASKRFLGENHPDTLEIIEILVLDYTIQRRYQEALELNEHVLRIRMQILGENHPDTQKALRQRASILGIKGNA